MAQPFDEIGGDPAPSQTKHLVIDYRYNQVAYRLVLKEQFPIAFEIKLPSSEAVAPGQKPEATELMKATNRPGGFSAASSRKSGPITGVECAFSASLSGMGYCSDRDDRGGCRRRASLD